MSTSDATAIRPRRVRTLAVLPGAAPSAASPAGPMPGVLADCDGAFPLVTSCSTVRNPGGEACFLSPCGPGLELFASGGGDTFSDATCNPGDEDVIEP